MDVDSSEFVLYFDRSNGSLTISMSIDSVLMLGIIVSILGHEIFQDLGWKHTASSCELIGFLLFCAAML